MEKKKVLIAAGGTGGHIYPALALARELSVIPSIEVAFAGGNLATNRYFDQVSYPVYSTSCGAFVNKNPFKLLQSFGKIVYGLYQSHKIMRTFRPDLAVGFGSYYTFPTLVAALLNRIPVVLHEANTIPGKVNRLLSPYALVTGVHFPATAEHLKGKTVLVGMPLRPGFKKGNVSVEEAKAYFRLSSGKPTLLVFGGSQGARAINQGVIKALSPPLRQKLQIIHLTGSPEETQIARSRYQEWHIEAAVKDFETRMDLAWTAADFAVGRAGAGTISEAIEFEVPSILIPFPQAADTHQELNADFMVQSVGGAEKLLEKDLQQLTSKIEEWLPRLKTYQAQIAAYKEKKSQCQLSDIIQEILGNR